MISGRSVSAYPHDDNTDISGLPWQCHREIPHYWPWTTSVRMGRSISIGIKLLRKLHKSIIVWIKTSWSSLCRRSVITGAVSVSDGARWILRVDWSRRQVAGWQKKHKEAQEGQRVHHLFHRILRREKCHTQRMTTEDRGSLSLLPEMMYSATGVAGVYSAIYSELRHCMQRRGRLTEFK